jgi:hypothetical protein
VINFQWEDNFKRGDRKGRHNNRGRDNRQASGNDNTNTNISGSSSSRDRQSHAQSSSSSMGHHGASSSSSHGHAHHQGRGSVNAGASSSSSSHNPIPSSISSHVAALSAAALDPTLAGIQAAAAAGYGSPAMYQSAAAAANFGLSAAAARQYMVLLVFAILKYRRLTRYIVCYNRTMLNVVIHPHHVNYL